MARSNGKYNDKCRATAGSNNKCRGNGNGNGNGRNSLLDIITIVQIA
jgi:hypothetical protein